MPLVSISDGQRAPIPNANVVATVHHGLPVDLHPPTFNPGGGYLAFLGRISPEKGVDRAIKVAQTVGIPLKIAAKVDRADETYFREQIAPLLEGPSVEFIGEINEQEKTDFLGQARALMFLIDWPEPFGLAMIEAMACGTPVLALRRGSVEEVVEEALTGRIVDSIEEATIALPDVMALDRRAVRRRFEERFTAARMASDYVRVYKSLLARADMRLLSEQAEAVHTTAAELANEPSDWSIDEAGVRASSYKSSAGLGARGYDDHSCPGRKPV